MGLLLALVYFNPQMMIPAINKVKKMMPELNGMPNEFTKSNLIEINLADNLPNGTYVLKLSSDDRCRNLKFTIIQ